jgi:hypothetical protein
LEGGLTATDVSSPGEFKLEGGLLQLMYLEGSSWRGVALAATDEGRAGTWLARNWISDAGGTLGRPGMSKQ